MAELGAGINELQVDLLEGKALGLGDQALAQRDWTLLGANAAAADHHKVLVDQAIVRETALKYNTLYTNKWTNHWVDGLGRDVILGGAILLAVGCQAGLANAVDLLVHFRAMVVTFLTSPSNRELHARWMPCANAGNLEEKMT